MTATDQPTFDALFNASRDPRLAALQDLKTAEGFPDIVARTTAVLTLHTQGLIVNEGVDLYGMSPFLLMRWWASDGYVWHEALFQAQPTSITDYTDASKAWPNSIKVSLDPNDYPAFSQTPNPTAASPVGPLGAIAGTYSAVMSAIFSNGVLKYNEGSTQTAPDGETVYFHQTLVGPFNFIGYEWETAAAKTARIAAGG